MIRTWSRLGAYSGWAAAAAIALMAWNGAFNLGGRGTRGGSIASGPTARAPVQAAGWTLNTPDDAVNAYLDLGSKAGNVIGELPTRRVVRREPTVLDGGQPGVRVVYIRQFVEQTVITDMARMATDENGELVPVPAAPSVPFGDPQ